MKASNFVRMAIAQAVAGSKREALAYAKQRWGQSAAVVQVLRSAVDAGDFDLAAQSASEFVREADTLSVLGKLQGVRRAPRNIGVCISSDAATAYWTGEGKATPMSRLAFERTALKALRASALVVLALDLLKRDEAQAEELATADLMRAVAKLTDAALLDPANAGINDVSPASITNAVAPITATGDLAADLAAMIDSYGGDFDTAAWAMNPRTAAQIAIRAGSRGIGAELGLRGGMLLGAPAYCTAGLPIDSGGGSIVLLDASALLVVDEGADLMVSTDAVLEMDDAPTGDSMTPAASSSSLVSLFQTESVGLQVTRRINWLAGRAPVVLSGANYTGA